MNTSLQRRLNHLEAQAQPQNGVGNSRLYRDEKWREYAAAVILNTLADGEWHQGHHTDSWQGTHGTRELWPILRAIMTWEEQCVLLQAFENMGVVEKGYPFWGNNHYDIFPEYRLNKGALCAYNSDSND